SLRAIAFAMALFWSATARNEEAQTKAAAERTRSARDICCSWDLSKARTRITVPTLMVTKRFHRSIASATKIVLSSIIGLAGSLGILSGLPMRLRAEWNKHWYDHDH